MRIPALAAVAALCAVPAVLWAFALPLEARFADAAVGLRSLAVVAALCGVAALSITVVLGARVWFLEPLFGGLDRLQAVHRAVAIAALALIGAHGALLVASLVIVAPEALEALLPWNASWQVNVGMLAGATLLSGIAVSLRGLRYDALVWVMRGLAALFLLALVHAFATPGTKSLSPALTYYLGGIAGLAVLAFAYRSLASDLVVPRRDYEVADVRRLDANVTEIVLRPRGAPLRFRPGQFVFVSFGDARLRREFHPFSITSAPGERDLRLVVKALGDYTAALGDLLPGTVARVEGPYGRLSHTAVANPRQVWVAGGIGITPFLSMARSLDAAGHEIDLYYCTEHADQAYYLDELFAIADRDMRVRVIPVRKDSLGRVTAEDIEGASHVLAKKDILISGPPAMIDNLTRQLRRLGVPRERIHFERFLYG